MPAVPALFIGTIAGGIFAIIFQPEIVKDIAAYDGNYLAVSYIALMKTMFGSVNIVSSNEFIKDINKETMSQIPSVLEDDRRYRWNTNECPRAWSKDYLPEEFIEPDVRYIKEITGDRWKFEIEPMPPKTY